MLESKQLCDIVLVAVTYLFSSPAVQSFCLPPLCCESHYTNNTDVFMTL